MYVAGSESGGPPKAETWTGGASETSPEKGLCPWPLGRLRPSGENLWDASVVSTLQLSRVACALEGPCPPTLQPEKERERERERERVCVSFPLQRGPVQGPLGRTLETQREGPLPSPPLHPAMSPGSSQAPALCSETLALFVPCWHFCCLGVTGLPRGPGVPAHGQFMLVMPAWRLEGWLVPFTVLWVLWPLYWLPFVTFAPSEPIWVHFCWVPFTHVHCFQGRGSTLSGIGWG